MASRVLGYSKYFGCWVFRVFGVFNPEVFKVSCRVFGV